MMLTAWPTEPQLVETGDGGNAGDASGDASEDGDATTAGDADGGNGGTSQAPSVPIATRCTPTATAWCQATGGDTNNDATGNAEGDAESEAEGDGGNSGDADGVPLMQRNS
jgi:hypothetical protein